jgi:4'-phosphopantetheinyl transferase
MIESGNPTNSSRMSWPRVTAPLSFPAERVSIWRVDLGAPTTEDRGTKILSADEITRANRFHFERDRLHFVRCRSALRRLIGEYLEIPAADVRFKYLANGKPEVEANQNPGALQFNVSHSGELALIAFCAGRQIGIDIEKIRQDVDTASLAERFFSMRERESLKSLPEQLRVLGFFACWTRKEAFLKSTGEGLSFPLSDFSVTTHPHGDAALEEIKGSAEAGQKWFLADLAVADEYRAALATEHPSVLLETFSLG